MEAFPRSRGSPGTRSTPTRAQPRYGWRNIIAGRFDPYIRAWAKRLARYGGRPPSLRSGDERRLVSVVGACERKPPSRVRPAWRHIHDIFRAAGATNVEWVWSPAAVTMHESSTPGDATSTRVAVAASTAASNSATRWRPFAPLLGHSLARLRTIAPTSRSSSARSAAPSTGGNKAAWIAGMFETLSRYPAITSVIWYDLDKVSDWQIRELARARRHSRGRGTSPLPLNRLVDRMALVRAMAGSRSGCHDPTFYLWKMLFVCCVGLPVAAWHLRRPRLDCTVADVSPTRRLIRILSRAQAQSPPVAGRLAQFCTALSLRPSCSTRLRVRALPEVQPRR